MPWRRAPIALEKSKSDREKILTSGKTELVEISDAERAQWVAAMKPVWKMFEDEVGKDPIDAALKSNQ